MISIFNKYEIISRYQKGQSKKGIGKELGISRNTVKKYIKEYEEQKLELESETEQCRIAMLQKKLVAPPKSKPHTGIRKAFTPAVEQRFRELMQEDAERDKLLGPNKQSLTAAHLHRILVEEGYRIGETTVRNEFRKYKQKHPECFIRQYYTYGERAEYDFHQIKVKIGENIRIYHQATISLPGSNYIFGRLYKTESFVSVADSLIKFFRFIGGVPKEMVFDNMSPVVKRFILGGKKEYTEGILKLGSYYGFRIKTCNPRSGNEKGHVENSGKSSRAEIFSLKYRFETETELMEYYREEMTKLNKDATEKFDEEKKHFQELPKHDYLLFQDLQCTVNTYSVISVDGHWYSVPEQCIGQKVRVHLFSDCLNIYAEATEELLHTWKRSNEKGGYSLDICHYLDTLEKKPGALAHSLALRQSPDKLKEKYNTDFQKDPGRFVEYLKSLSNGEGGAKAASENTAAVQLQQEEIAAESMKQLDKLSEVFNLGRTNGNSGAISA